MSRNAACFLLLALMVAVTCQSLVAVPTGVGFEDPFSGPCPKANQEHTRCGTACPPTCANPAPTICTLQCIIGCQCKSGYLMNNDGECVLQQNC